MIKNDEWIKKMVFEYDMINPFEPIHINKIKKPCYDINNVNQVGNQCIQKVISFGVSSYGYDVKLSSEFMVMDNKKTKIIDPKKSHEILFKSVIVKDYIKVLPYSLVLGRTVEYFKIPRNVITIAFGKSTYARCGILVNVTPFEPEWEGYVTLSIVNTASVPVKVYVNEGIAQVMFLKSDEVCKVSYLDRKGKYQSQKDIVLAKI
ncbi:MAG: dCTP deaminase [Endomicrobium sp.]|jgi:dCTP deaminase|nr:dCTP deaminase [Endomicrobium sp.]